MTIELDHVFICTDVDAPEAAEVLTSLGLVEGSASTHPGQGTANRRYFFRNVMLELLWIQDPAAAQSELTRPTYLWERWSERQQVCPFGIGWRPRGETVESLPFATWSYHPLYLPAPLVIEVGTNISQLKEPMLFYLAFGQRPDRRSPERAQPMEHAAGWQELTQLTLVLPDAEPVSAELGSLVASGLITLKQGSEYRLELGFDGELKRQSYDCRPTLPLVIHC